MAPMASPASCDKNLTNLLVDQFDQCATYAVRVYLFT